MTKTEERRLTMDEMKKIHICKKCNNHRGGGDIWRHLETFGKRWKND